LIDIGFVGAVILPVRLPFLFYFSEIVLHNMLKIID